MTTNTLRATYAGGQFGWRGAIKDGNGHAVWECEHNHHNRDMGSYTYGPAAIQCSMTKLAEIDPEAARRQRGY